MLDWEGERRSYEDFDRIHAIYSGDVSYTKFRTRQLLYHFVKHEM